MPAVNVRDDEDEEVEGDMTPFIDIIFLLLIFFILTTKFIPEEKVITNLLPTDKGTANAKAPIDEKEEVHVKIYPAFLSQGMQPSQYDSMWKDSRDVTKAKYQVGNTEYIEVDGHTLTERGSKTGGEVNSALDNVHGYLHSHLANFEAGGTRKDQPPVIIHGFSGMPWKYVLAAYDAVREWENKQGGSSSDMNAMLNAREVTFAPPRVRGYRKWEMGYELFEIIHMK